MRPVRLENRQGRKPLVSSNLTLSAIKTNTYGTNDKPDKALIAVVVAVRCRLDAYRDSAMTSPAHGCKQLLEFFAIFIPNCL